MDLPPPKVGLKLPEEEQTLCTDHIESWDLIGQKTVTLQKIWFLDVFKQITTYSSTFSPHLGGCRSFREPPSLCELSFLVYRLKIFILVLKKGHRYKMSRQMSWPDLSFLFYCFVYVALHKVELKRHIFPVCLNS